MTSVAQFHGVFRQTIVVHGRLALRTERLRVAREGLTGVQVMAIEHMAERLAGGFLKMVDTVTLKKIVSEVLPETDVGEFEPIKALPGMVSASASTLMKLWLADSDLDRFKGSSRVRSILSLEEAVVRKLPAHIKRPGDIIELAKARAPHAKAVFGKLVLKGMTELHPVWQPLLEELSTFINVVWESGPRQRAAWLSSLPTVTTTKPENPDIRAISCANGRHEAVEAVRWVRAKLAEGIDPARIAIATVSTASYDDHIISAAEDAGLGLHSVHGVPAVSTRDGQTAAALADILQHGLSQKKVRRLVDLIGPGRGPFADLPADWGKAIKEDAALTELDRWRRMLDRSQNDINAKVSTALMPTLRLLDQGLGQAHEIGEHFLQGQALSLWQRALIDGPAAALERTLSSLRVDDERDPHSSPCFMSAENLAACPRDFVFLVGLNSRNWPRRASEDALIPDHVIPTAELDPMPITEMDRRDFNSIVRTTSVEVVLCWPRRDAEGRVLGVSSLVPQDKIADHEQLQRTRTPSHAMSEADRLFARPEEFGSTAVAMKAIQCWHNWRSPHLTAHDGLIPTGHPRMKAVFERLQSPTSIRTLLRDPQAFMWRYGLGFHLPEYEDQPLTRDQREFGNIVHMILRQTVENLGRAGGFAHHSTDQITAAISDATFNVAQWAETSGPVPPKLIWHSIVNEAESFSVKALVNGLGHLLGQVSYAEVPFGGGREWERDDYPWDPHQEVVIPGTDLKVRGYIDRVDLSECHGEARVVDYKAGRMPKNLTEIFIDGGKEVQRIIYRFALNSMLGPEVKVEAGLMYPNEGVFAPLPETDMTLDHVAGFIAIAKKGVLDGRALPGIDAPEAYNDMRFAFPSNAAADYLTLKNPVILDHLGDAVNVWEQQ